MPTKISWCDETINPIRTTDGGWYCTKTSPGCKNCYSEGINMRFGNHKRFSSGVDFGFKLNRSMLDKLLKWKKPRRIFVQSMSDLFHEEHQFGLLRPIFRMMLSADHHKYIILTKRPEKMKRFFDDLKYHDDFTSMGNLDHVWIGVSCENQEQANKRIPVLLSIPAVNRFVSVEPMLSGIRLPATCTGCGRIGEMATIHQKEAGHVECPDCLSVEQKTISWIVCGTEKIGNKPGRPVDIEHIRNLKNQCVESGVPFFLKQMPIDGKLVKMPELDGRVWGQLPGGLA